MEWKIVDIFDGEGKGYLGVSTTAKPTEGVGVFDLAIELDTGKIYYFNGEEWAKYGANAE